jgi:hypothetical protein
MMDNPPAFPSRRDEPLLGGGSYRNDRPGMSLRDWFAGQALIGRSFIVADATDDLTTASGLDLSTAAGMAASCYELADAMLLARSPVSDNGEG